MKHLRAWLSAPADTATLLAVLSIFVVVTVWGIALALLFIR